MCFCGKTDRGVFTHAPLTPPGPDGWRDCTVCDRASEWTCPHCGDRYGSNLLGQAPFREVGQHRARCHGPQPDPCPPRAIPRRVARAGRYPCRGRTSPQASRCAPEPMILLCDDAESYAYR